MLVIVPSRGRPANVAELIVAWRQTRSYADLLIVVDDDDETLEEYRAAVDGAPSWVRFEVAPRKRLGPTLNDFALKNADDYDIIGFMGDDHRPRTFRFDTRFAGGIAALGGVGITYGNDYIQGVNLPTAVWMSSCIIETLGFMVPPGMIHLYLDDFWKALGMRLQRLAYLNDVIIEHMHPVAGKAQWDERYAEVNSGEMYENDGRLFQEYLQTRLAVDAQKIVESCVIR
jgi:glycosyltransferase involved in cell wall biosynthesis